MNATVIKDAIDRIDTGLPDRPDLLPVLTRGRRLRRRRRAGIGLGIGLAIAAMAAAIAVPAGLLAGDDGRGLDPGTDPSTSSPSLPPGWSGASEAFGTTLQGRVRALFPGVWLSSEDIADHYLLGSIDGGPLGFHDAVNDPVDWPHVFHWQQFYRQLDVGYDLFVDTAWRDSTTGEHWDFSELCVVVSDQATETCQESKLDDGRTVFVHDGFAYGGPRNWARSVEVVSETSGEKATQVVVTATATGGTWAEAEAQLPDLETLADLATDPDILLPEPESIPVVEE